MIGAAILERVEENQKQSWGSDVLITFLAWGHVCGERRPGIVRSDLISSFEVVCLCVRWFFQS